MVKTRAASESAQAAKAPTQPAKVSTPAAKASTQAAQAPTQAVATTPEANFILEEELETRSGTLRIEIEVQAYEPYEACTRLEVNISQRLNRAKKYTNIGYMVGFLVDKTTTSKIKQSKSKSKSKSKVALWVKELLRQEEQLEEDQTHQVREISRALFNKTGGVRATLRAHRDELSAERFLFIDVFMLYDAYRQRGAGRQPMRMFLQLLPLVLGAEEGESADVPCILSPGASEDVTIENGKSVVEIETALIRSYERNDFEIWLQGDPDVENSLTVMGRMV